MIRQDSSRSISVTLSQNGAEISLSGIARSATGAPGIVYDNVLAATTTLAGSAAAPATGTTNEWDHMVVKNIYAGANTVEIKLLGGTATTHTFYGVLQQNESAEYTHAGGWKTLDAYGQEKVTLTATGGNFTVGGDLSVAGTLGVTGASTLAGLITANAGISIPTGQSITGAGTAAITGFASASLGAISGTTGTFSGNTMLFGGAALGNWNTSYQNFQFGATGLGFNAVAGNSTYLGIGQNVYFNLSWKRSTANPASKLDLNNGIIYLSTAATGAIDSSVIWVNTAIISSTGLAVTGTLSATDIVSFTNTTDATSSTAGGTIVSGGLAVAKAIQSGGAITATYAGAVSAFTRTGVNGIGVAQLLVPGTDAATANDGILLPFNMKNSVAAFKNYGGIKTVINDATSTTEDATVSLGAITAGTLTYPISFTGTAVTVTGTLSASSYLGVNGATAVAPTAGYGTPTGNSITTNFPGVTATLAQTTGTLAQVILDLKRAGIVLN